MQTLEGHAQNVTAVAFHPELPIIMTGSEDGRREELELYYLYLNMKNECMVQELGGNGGGW